MAGFRPASGLEHRLYTDIRRNTCFTYLYLAAWY